MKRDATRYYLVVLYRPLRYTSDFAYAQALSSHIHRETGPKEFYVCLGRIDEMRYGSWSPWCSVYGLVASESLTSSPRERIGSGKTAAVALRKAWAWVRKNGHTRLA